MPDPRVPGSRDLARLWQTVLGQLEMEVSPHHFNTWLKGTRPLHAEHGTLTIEARTAFACDWLGQRLAGQIQLLASGLWDEPLDVRFVPRGAAAIDGPALRAGPAPAAARPTVIGTLNWDFTFERYIRAEGNFLAVQSCSGLLEEVQARVSPVVLYGTPGMGKTHLLHALACRAAAAAKSVACLSAEEFASRYMTALRSSELPAWQASIRSVSLFVLDDLQYLAGRKGTLDELVHTIDAISNNGGHVAIGSEQNPIELDLPPRLTSRLASGIVTQIAPFRFPERLAFARQLSAERGCILPTWTLDRIAGIETPSVRFLQGAVNSALALARAEKLDLARLDTELTRLAIHTAAPADRQSHDRAIVEAVARYFETTFAEVAGRSRQGAVARARAVAVAVLRERGRSLGAIATLLDGRDRSTVNGLIEKGQSVLAEDDHLRQHLAG